MPNALLLTLSDSGYIEAASKFGGSQFSITSRKSGKIWYTSLRVYYCNGMPVCIEKGGGVGEGCKKIL